MRIRSISGIAAAFLGSVALATVIAGLGMYVGVLHTLDRQVDRRLAAEAKALEPVTHGADLASVSAYFARDGWRRDSADIAYLLVDRQGRALAGDIYPRRIPREGYSTLGAADGIAGLTRGRALVQHLPSGATLMLAAESEAIDNYDRRRGTILIIGFGIIALVVVGGTVLLTLTLGRRIEAVRRTAEAIVDGNLHQRVPRDHSGSAFDRQAEAFNHMLDRIEALVGSLASLSNDVAHDLRTPVTRLRSQLTALAARAEAEPLQDAIGGAMAQSDDILALFDAILRIAEVEGGERRSRFAPLDLATMAAGAVEALEPMAEESGHRLVVEPGSAVPIEGDAALLNQLIVNLIENAVHHTPAGTVIRLGPSQRAGMAELRVADNGPGIPPAERELALRRFGRLDRSRHQPGHGLGLPLVEAIARLHRGTIALEDAEPGLAVVIRLPLLT